MAGVCGIAGGLEQKETRTFSSTVKSFSGQQVVDWLLTRRTVLRTKSALDIGMRLIKHGLIRPIKGVSIKFTPRVAYTFTEDFMAAQSKVSWARMTTEHLKQILKEAHSNEPALPKVQVTGTALSKLFVEIYVANASPVANELCDVLLKRSLILPVRRRRKGGKGGKHGHDPVEASAHHTDSNMLTFDPTAYYTVRPGILDALDRSDNKQSEERAQAPSHSRWPTTAEHKSEAGVRLTPKSLTPSLSDPNNISPPSALCRQLDQYTRDGTKNSQAPGRALPQEWVSVQSYGNDMDSDVNADEFITYTSFDKTGKHLAIGDMGGRISVIVSKDTGPKMVYQFLVEFKSFRSEFDIYKSHNVPPAITSMCFWPTATAHPLLLATNGASVRMWKLCEASPARRPFVTPCSKDPEPRSGNRLSLAPTPHDHDPPRGSKGAASHSPKSSKSHRASLATISGKLEMEDAEDQDTARAILRQNYKNGHSFAMNSISPNADGESFLTSDAMSVCVWNVNRTDVCYNVLQNKPSSPNGMFDVADITTASFHPISENLLCYGDTSGLTRLKDMRVAATLEKASSVRLTPPPETNPAAGAYPRFIHSIHDCQFTADGRFIITRDLMRLSLWALAKPSSPLLMFEVHPHMWRNAFEVVNGYRKAPSHRFRVATNGQGGQCVTGSFENTFIVCSRYSNEINSIVASETQQHGRRNEVISVSNSSSMHERTSVGNKVLHCDWHPRREALAVAGAYKLWLYQASGNTYSGRSSLLNTPISGINLMGL